MSDPLLLGGALAVGYLAGSISAAVVVGRLVAPAVDLRRVTIRFGSGGEAVPSGGASATNARLLLGTRWGVVVALLDVAKAALPTLAFESLLPGSGAGVLAGGAAVVGHVFPIWHGLRGGYGVSPILGTFLVVDPLALAAALLVAALVGLVVADRLVTYDSWTLLLVPALALRGDALAALVAALVAALYWRAMREEVLEHVRRVRRGGRPWRVRFGEIRAGYTGSLDAPVGPARVRALPRVAGHDAVKAAGRDWGRWSSAHRGDEDVRTYRQLPLESDPPEHTGLRGALVPFLSRGALEPHREAIRADAATLLRPLAAGDSVELVEGVALPFVVGSIARVLDLEADAPRLRSFGLSVWGDHEGRRDGVPFHAFLDELLDRGARGDAGRVLGALAATPVGGAPLDRETLTGILSLLLAAGRDTVVGLVAGLGWGLVARPDLVPLLVATGDRGTSEGMIDARDRFVEEVLRLTSDLVMERIDRGPDGRPVAIAPHVALDFPSANHDATAFPAPAEIRLDRPNPRGHLAFGIGAHACLGATLARLEGRAMLDALLEAAPAGLELDPGAGRDALVADRHLVDGVEIPTGFRRLVVRGRSAGTTNPGTGPGSVDRSDGADTRI
ncbi:MAG: hypothetical protein RL338_378 [Chloroflexota bacterium]